MALLNVLPAHTDKTLQTFPTSLVLLNSAYFFSSLLDLRIFTDVLPLLLGATRVAHDLFIELCRRAAGSNGALISASVSELSLATGISCSSVQRALRQLEGLGLIMWKSGGGRQTNKIWVLAFVTKETNDESRTTEARDVPECSGTSVPPETIGATDTRPPIAARPRMINPFAFDKDCQPVAQNETEAPEPLAELVARAYHPLSEEELAEVRKLAPDAMLRRILQQMAGSRTIPCTAPLDFFLLALTTQVKVGKREAAIREESQ